MKNLRKINIIIPCFNEEASLPFLIDALNTVSEQLEGRYQLDIMLINDGSSDKTQSVINKLSKQEHIYYREFARNMGHQAALRAGLDVSLGYDAAIMMDADMQHPPELIPEILKAWEGGAKIVQMIRKDNLQDVGIVKYSLSHFYYALINLISDLKLEYGASDFRLIDNKAISMVYESPEKDLFLRGYFAWLPISRTTIIYKPNKRIAGKSNYTFRKSLGLANTSILQFSDKPLRLTAMLGIGLSMIAFIYGITLIILHLLGSYTVRGWTSLMVVVLFCFGVIITILGVIGSYLARSIDIQKKRPEFIAEKEKIPEIIPFP